MKKILYILPILASCATNVKDYDYVTFEIPYVDTIVINEWHEHLIMDNCNYCIDVPRNSTLVNDTVTIQLPVIK